MGRDQDSTDELLRSIYAGAEPADLRETYLKYRRGREGGVRLGRGRKTTQARKVMVTKAQQIEAERTLFLLTILSIAPQVLEELRSSVLSVFGRRQGRAGLAWWQVQSLARLRPLRDVLQKWGERWHMVDDWLMQATLDTLTMWERDRHSREAFQWALPSQSVRVPRRLRRVKYPAPTKRARAGKATMRRDDDPLLHYTWTVMYQCLKMDPDKIAQAHTDADPLGNRFVTTSAIKKAIVKTARRIGLGLRTELRRSSRLPSA